MYHAMTDVYTATLLPTKSSSDDHFGFRHGFKVEALPLTQSAPVVTPDTTRHCGIAISTLMHLEPYLRSLCISSCLMEKVQD